MDRSGVASSNVASVGYDAVAETLEIEFHSGAIYQYYGVPSGVYEDLMSTPSKGSYLHRNVRHAFPYSRVG